MKTTKCTICQTRPRSAQVKREYGYDYCLPCLTLAEWENTHSDSGHGDGPNDEKPNDCWVCFPELDETRADYTGKTGTSRVGMVLRVPLKASGAEKAEAVRAQLPAATRRQVKISAEKQGTVLTLERKKASSMQLCWDNAGRFVRGTVDDHRIRNVSEALRVLGY
jgi:hypothetical protein